MAGCFNILHYEQSPEATKSCRHVDRKKLAAQIMCFACPRPRVDVIKDQTAVQLLLKLCECGDSSTGTIMELAL